MKSSVSRLKIGSNQSGFFGGVTPKCSENFKVPQRSCCSDRAADLVEDQPALVVPEQRVVVREALLVADVVEVIEQSDRVAQGSVAALHLEQGFKAAFFYVSKISHFGSHSSGFAPDRHPGLDKGIARGVRSSPKPGPPGATTARRPLTRNAMETRYGLPRSYQPISETTREAVRARGSAREVTDG